MGGLEVMPKVLSVTLTLAATNKGYLAGERESYCPGQYLSCHTDLAKNTGGTWPLRGNRTALECGAARTTGSILSLDRLAPGQPPASQLPVSQVPPDKREGGCEVQTAFLSLGHKQTLTP